MIISPIIPVSRRDPFDGPGWTYELKYDGFRGLADTVAGRMLSKRGSVMARFAPLLARLPPGCVLDGEIACLDDDGRPVFTALMFGRRPPVYIAFDVLVAEGEDLRARPLRERKAVLKRLARGARGWIAITDGVLGEGRALFDRVAAMDLEGIIAKRLDDPYAPQTRWWKVLNPSYSQKEGRGELFNRAALKPPSVHGAPA